jgi:hypothetical protein
VVYDTGSYQEYLKIAEELTAWSITVISSQMHFFAVLQWNC